MDKIRHLGYVSLLFILACHSCTDKRKNSIDADYSCMDTIRYDYRDDRNVVPRDSVFGRISFVPLETRDDNLIGMVDQVLFGDSTIIIVDRYIANGVFLFDFNGRYVGRMSMQGNGRNEYRRLAYVSKRPDGLFAILDDVSNLIMLFDERGNHMRTGVSDLYASAMEFIGQDMMAFNIYARYPDFEKPYYGASFVVKNQDMDVEYLFAYPGFDNHFNYSRYYNLYSYADKVYCNVNFEDYIYEMDRDGVKAKYRILFGPENVSRHPFKTQEDYLALKKQYPYFEGEFVELDDYTYIMFRGNNGRELIYRHSDKDTYALSSGFNNPLIAFFRRPMARFGQNTLVCALPVSEALLCKGVLTATSPQNEEINRFFSSVTADSNPILFFFDIVL